MMSLGMSTQSSTPLRAMDSAIGNCAIRWNLCARSFLRVQNVGKVDLIGVQKRGRLCRLFDARIGGARVSTPSNLRRKRCVRRNAVNASGVLEASHDRVAVRVSGQLNSVANIEAGERQREWPIGAIARSGNREPQVTKTRPRHFYATTVSRQSR